MKNKKRNFDQLDRDFLQSRRSFMTKVSVAMAAAGVAQSTSFNFVEELAKKIIPQAHAQSVGLPQRMIFIGLRSGIPVMPLGIPSLFKSLDTPLTPNVPFRGNELTEAAGGLNFSSDSMPLMRHAESLLVTQGIASEGGHTNLFNFWQGGMGQNQTSPIIELASRNTSGSVLPGVHFTQNANGNRVVAHRNNDLPDLLTTHNMTFKNNFKKASLAIDDAATEKVLDASVKLSRRQALRLQASMSNSLNYSTEHEKGAELLSFDYSAALDPASVNATLNTGVNGTYVNFGAALANTLKAMSFNLVNSSTVELSIGDWHGLNNMTATRLHYAEIAAKLAAAVDYLKATPDIAGPPGTTLWDTTSIVMGSEFNRNDSTFGRDNGDGGTQGILILSKKVKGGYFGGAEYLGNADAAGNPRILRFSGVDRMSGQLLPMGQRNTTRQLYHTINTLVGNRALAADVISAYLK